MLREHNQEPSQSNPNKSQRNNVMYKLNIDPFPDPNLIGIKDIKRNDTSNELTSTPYFNVQNTTVFTTHIGIDK